MKKGGMGGSKGNKSVSGHYPHMKPKGGSMTGGKSVNKTMTPLGKK